MVIWMFANDEDIIRIDEFLYFYHLKSPRIQAIGSLNHGVGVRDWFLTPFHLSGIGKPIFSLTLAMVGNLLQVRT